MKNKLWLKLISTPKGRVFLKPVLGKAAVGDGKDFVIAARMKNKWLGSMTSSIHDGVATVKDVRIAEEARGFGISKSMFKTTMQRLQALGAKMIRSTDMLHPAQVKIRGHYKTKFLVDHMGKYGEDIGLVSKQSALDIMKSNESGKFAGRIRSVTKIPEDINSLPKIRFIRKHGRIIPIRPKK